MSAETKIIEAGVDSVYRITETKEEIVHVPVNRRSVVPMQSLPPYITEYQSVTHSIYYTKLTLACHNNDLAEVTKLLDEGADVNKIPIEMIENKITVGDTDTILGSPLYEVLMAPNYDQTTIKIVKLLIAHGADINYRFKLNNELSDTPLYNIYSRANNSINEYKQYKYDSDRKQARIYLHTAELLLEHGATIKYGSYNQGNHGFGFTDEKTRNIIKRLLSETQSIRSMASNAISYLRDPKSNPRVVPAGGRRTRKLRRSRRSHHRRN